MQSNIPLQFDTKKPTALMLGRYQPFHDGHFALFKEALKRTGQVLIAVRNTEKIDEKNPFNFDFVKKQIDDALVDYVGKYMVILIPNITNIVYGRDVGYLIEKIDLDAATESISATDIRKKLGY
jgi:adenylylsulfate kinase